MLMDVLRNRIVRSQRRRENERQLILANDVARLFFRSGLRSGIGETLKTESGLVEMRGLFCVADIKLHIIRSLKRQEIDFGGRLGFRSGDGCFHRNLAFSNAAMLTHRDRLSNGLSFSLRSSAASWCEYKSSAAHRNHRAKSARKQ